MANQTLHDYLMQNNAFYRKTINEEYRDRKSPMTKTEHADFQRLVRESSPTSEDESVPAYIRNIVTLGDEMVKQLMDQPETRSRDQAIINTEQAIMWTLRMHVGF